MSKVQIIILYYYFGYKTAAIILIFAVQLLLINSINFHQYSHS